LTLAQLELEKSTFQKEHSDCYAKSKELNGLRNEQRQWAEKGKELSALRESQAQYWNKDRNELDALRTDKEQWKRDRLDLQRLQNLETQWKSKSMQLDTLLANQSEWQSDHAELCELRTGATQWRVDGAELDRLRPLEAQWQSNGTELQQLRSSKYAWESAATELKGLQSLQAQWKNDNRELQEHRAAKPQRDHDAVELSRLRPIESQWKKDQIELQGYHDAQPQWQASVDELARLHPLELQWKNDQMELQSYRDAQPQWQAGVDELARLRPLKSQWKKDQIELQSYRKAQPQCQANADELARLQPLESQWRNEHTELGQLRLAQTKWQSDATSLRQLQDLEDQRQNDKEELGRYRSAQAQWQADSTELKTLRTEVVQHRLQAKSDATLIVQQKDKNIELSQANEALQETLTTTSRLLITTREERLSFRRQLVIASNDLDRVIAQRNMFLRGLNEQVHTSIALKVRIVIVTAWFRYRTRQLRESEALHATLQEDSLALSNANDQLRNEIYAVRYMGILVCVCLKLTRSQLASLIREKAYEVAQRLNLENTLLRVRIVVMISFSVLHAHCMILQREKNDEIALRMGFKASNQRLLIVNVFLTMSFRNLRTKLSNQGHETLTLQQKMRCSRIVSFLLLQTLRSSRTKLAAAEAERHDESKLRISNESNVIGLRQTCQYLFESRVLYMDARHDTMERLDCEMALRMTWQQRENDIRIAFYIVIGLCRSLIMLAFYHFALEKVYEHALSWSSSGHRELIRRFMNQANALTTQNDYIANLRRENETLQQQKDNIEKSAFKELDYWNTKIEKLLKDRIHLRNALASSHKREFELETQVRVVLEKADKLIVKHQHLAERIAKIDSALDPMLKRHCEACKPYREALREVIDADCGF
jgi:hypothetical protein